MLFALIAVTWLVVGTAVSYRVEPKVTRIAMLVLGGILLWPLTAWLGHRRTVIAARRAAHAAADTPVVDRPTTAQDIEAATAEALLLAPDDAEASRLLMEALEVTHSATFALLRPYLISVIWADGADDVALLVSPDCPTVRLPEVFAGIDLRVAHVGG